MTESEFETMNWNNGDRTIPVRRFKPFNHISDREVVKLSLGIDATGNPVDVPRELISPKQLFEARLGRIGTKADQIYLRAQSIATNILVIPDPDPESYAIKLAPRVPLLFDLDLKTGDRDYDLSCTKDSFEATEGFLVPSELARELSVNHYAFPEKRAEILEFLAEGDSELNNAYGADVQSIKDSVANDENCMFEKSWIGKNGIEFCAPKLDYKVMRWLRINSISRENDEFSYFCRSMLSSGNMLVGVPTPSGLPVIVQLARVDGVYMELTIPKRGLPLDTLITQASDPIPPKEKNTFEGELRALYYKYL